MAGRIRDADIAVLRERADMAAVVGTYTNLQRAGGSRLKGLCPFHDEKTPSFSVDTARGMYHCFGCGVGGDVYDFLQRVEALTFPEAVERLARLTGFELQYEELTPGQRRVLGRRTRLAEAIGEAADFYAGLLIADEGTRAQDYLRDRGLSDADIAHFRLGWAPDSWDRLSRHLLARGFDAQELVDAGLSSHGRQGPVDRFRGRVIFPIVDRGGRDVVAFGGRVLPGVELQTGPRDGPPPKYINSSETELYRKSETLYGLNWARGEIQRRESVLVVEGYMDVIGLHLGGVRYAVATCGTALTADHFRQLERFTRRVILALDADDAGYAAAERARQLAQDAGIKQVGVLPLPSGQDPADLARAGADALDAALAGVKTAVQFQIEHLLRGADVGTPEGQVEAYTRTFPLLAQIPDRALRYTYIRDVVRPVVGLSADRIEAELDREMTRAGWGNASSAAPPQARSEQIVQMGGVSAGRLKDPQMALERDVLRAALQTPELLPEGWKHVVPEDFTAPVSQQLFLAITGAPSSTLVDILAALPDDDARARVRALALSDPTVEPDAAHVARLVMDLRVRSLKRQVEEIHTQLTARTPESDPDGYRAATRRKHELEQRWRALVEGREA